MTTLNILRWTPRACGILYSLFISLFALDVWGMDGSFWAKLGGFLIHLLPVYFIMAALVFAWVRPWIGGFLFLILAAAFSLFFGWQEVSTLLLLALPPVIIGLLFIADGYVGRSQVRPQI